MFDCADDEYELFSTYTLLSPYDYKCWQTSLAKVTFSQKNVFHQIKKIKKDYYYLNGPNRKE